MTADVKDKYKYDVAISFRSADLGVAQEIQAKLGGATRTFVYTSEQPTLGGTNLAESCREVFRNESRLLVVLYRNGWGGKGLDFAHARPLRNQQSEIKRELLMEIGDVVLQRRHGLFHFANIPAYSRTLEINRAAEAKVQKGPTLIEERAIIDHCVEHGWHLVFVMMQPDATPPKWLPESHIRLDLSQYGLEQVVGAIKLRLQELGTVIREETVRERAERLRRTEAAREQLRKKRLEEGSQAPMTEARAVFDGTDTLLSEFKSDALLDTQSSRNGNEFGVRTSLATVIIYAELVQGGDSRLHLRGEHGRTALPGTNEFNWEKPNADFRETFVLDVSLDKGWCWKQEGRRNALALTSAEMADHVVERLVDLHDKISDKRKRQ